VRLTVPGEALRTETRCLLDTLLERSGLDVGGIIALNAQMQALLAALGKENPV
jgi:hypothetical protein